MARPVRIPIPGATYLVRIRAKQGEELFTSEEERALFLLSMGEAAFAAGVKIYAFSLLQTSALLFVRSGPDPLSGFVHRSLAGFFNRLRAFSHRNKPLVHDRHREILVEEGAPFFPILQRVHLAPIIGRHWSNQSEGRKWGEISTNRWTSYPVFIGSLPAPPGFDREVVLKRFELPDKDPVKLFADYIIQGVKEHGEDVLDHVHGMTLFGTPEFVDHYMGAAKSREALKLRPQELALAAAMTQTSSNERFHRILRHVAAFFDTTQISLVRVRSRDRGRKYLVELAARYALDESGIAGLGKRLNTTGSAIAHLRRAFRMQLRKDETARDLFDRLEIRVLQDQFKDEH